MNRKKRVLEWTGAALFVAGLVMTIGLFGQSVPQSFPQDNGPYKLDVSGYPKQIRKDYKVFSHKCGICHSLARPLNTTMTPAQWKQYVSKMQHKPGAMINNEQAREIKAFLIYDQIHRKDKNPKKFFPPIVVK